MGVAMENMTKTPEQNFNEFNQSEITVTTAAVNRFMAVMEGEGKTGFALRFGVESGGCSGLNYIMTFDNNSGPNDKIFESNGLKVFCDIKSWLYVKGSTIDYSDDLLNGGFKITNPNADRTCGCGTSFSA